MIHFDNWKNGQLNEAGQFGKFMQQTGQKIKDILPGAGKRRQQQQQQQQQQQDVDASNDPEEIRNKSIEFSANLMAQFRQMAPGARPETKTAIQKMMKDIIAAYTQGQYFGPNNIEPALIAVHKDPDISYKYKDYYWKNHTYVLARGVDPAFKASPSAWYVPNDSNQMYPPNIQLDYNAINQSAQDFGKSGFVANKPKDKKKPLNVKKQVLKRYPDEETTSWEEIKNFITYLEKWAKENGYELQITHEEWFELINHSSDMEADEGNDEVDPSDED